MRKFVNNPNIIFSVTIILFFVACFSFFVFPFPTQAAGNCIYQCIGKKGEMTRLIQQRLKDLGYNIKVDGKYGKDTAKAVEEFQKRNALLVDGKAGINTAKKLFKDVPATDDLVGKLKTSYNKRADEVTAELADGSGEVGDNAGIYDADKPLPGSEEENGNESRPEDWDGAPGTADGQPADLGGVSRFATPGLKTRDNSDGDNAGIYDAKKPLPGSDEVNGNKSRPEEANTNTNDLVGLIKEESKMIQQTNEESLANLKTVNDAIEKNIKAQQKLMEKCPVGCEAEIKKLQDNADELVKKSDKITKDLKAELEKQKKDLQLEENGEGVASIQCLALADGEGKPIDKTKINNTNLVAYKPSGTGKSDYFFEPKNAPKPVRPGTKFIDKGDINPSKKQVCCKSVAQKGKEKICKNVVGEASKSGGLKGGQRGNTSS